MLAKKFLPLATALGLSTAALAQSPAAVPLRNLPAATTDRQQIVEFQQRQLQAEIRRDWLASGHKIEPPVVLPSITKGVVPIKSFDAASPPAAPIVKVTFQTGPSGMQSVGAFFYSEATSQFLYINYQAQGHAPPVTSGTIAFQSTTGPCYFYCGAFNAYSAGGKWDLDVVEICDNASNCTSYNGAANLDPLFPHGRIIKLTNAGTPDKAPPLVTAGKLLTPKVSLSSANPDFGARLTVSDNRSGVAQIFVYVCPPSGSSASCVYTYFALPAAAQNATARTYDWLCYSTGSDCSTTPTGKWTITEFGACDIAHNCVYDTSLPDIQSLFGTTTFKVVN